MMVNPRWDGESSTQAQKRETDPAWSSEPRAVRGDAARSPWRQARVGIRTARLPEQEAGGQTEPDRLACTWLSEA